MGRPRPPLQGGVSIPAPLIDFLASERHYADHLAPIWQAMAPERRGRFVASPLLTAHLRSYGIDVTPGFRVGPGDGPVVVASINDHEAARPRPTVMVNHGAGQTYGGDPRGAGNPSYSDGRREGCVLFVCPSEHDAARCRSANPGADVVVAGSPRVDYLRAITAGETGGEKAIVVSFHWNNSLVPESRWAFPYFKHAIKSLAEGVEILGHGHPRVWRYLERWYAARGIEPVRDFDEVVLRARLYVCDNSSTMYEWAALDRPVLCLNAPWYRRNVSHGLRFWSHVPGLECNDPADLRMMMALASDDPPVAQSIRERAVAHTYAFRDGRAAEKAAREIEALPA